MDSNISSRMTYISFFPPWPSFSMSNFWYFIWFANGDRLSKHYYCHLIGSHVFTIQWHHCKCCISWPWPTFLRLRNLKCEYLGWYSPLNRTIVPRQLHDLDIHFQSQTLIYQWWEVEQTLLLPSYRKSCVCYPMAPLQMLHVMTLTYIFKVTKFEMWISRLIFAIE